MGNSTLDVRDRYRDAGLDTAQTFKDAPDHISAELEFMHYLIYKEIEAFANYEMKMAIAFIQRQKSFLEDHLMAWVPEFAKSIIEHARNPFYPNLARATEMFLKENYKIVCTAVDSKELTPEEPVGINPLLV